MSDLTLSIGWRKLNQHFEDTRGQTLRELFASDPDRAETFSAEAAGLFLDYSKNRITAETMDLLIGLARELRIEKKRDEMFEGKTINATENRAVLHTALRNRSNTPVIVNGEDVMPAVNEVLANMRVFTESVRSGQRKGYSGKAITDVVNIGIGGSYLGPELACGALVEYGQQGPAIHFLANIDGAAMTQMLRKLNAETTLFIIASKTFSTIETMSNAKAARAWLVEAAGDEQAVAKHFVAVSTHAKRVREFGIEEINRFGFWDWVGGRYSMWSAIGLPIALSIGMDGFEDMLSGAHEMDRHFSQAPLESNLPVILALLGVWYINFHGADSCLISPYSQALQRFPAHLQQVDMESNGKGVTKEGETVNHSTGPVVWGEPGTNSQHAYFQLVHQGTRLIPVDFIAPLRSQVENDPHHALLVANCFAQSEALMLGKNEDEVRQELEAQDLHQDEIAALLPHKVFPGNRPSNTITMDKLTPKTLGALIALYEHKVFCQGAIWDINSFDQWGVELGKHLAGTVLDDLTREQEVNQHDGSTQRLIRRFKAANLGSRS